MDINSISKDYLVLILSLILALLFHKDWLGKLLMFLAFLVIMCAVFDTYIPFDTLIEYYLKLACIVTMICLGGRLIFLPKSFKKNTYEN